MLRKVNTYIYKKGPTKYLVWKGGHRVVLNAHRVAEFLGELLLAAGRIESGQVQHFNIGPVEIMGRLCGPLPRGQRQLLSRIKCNGHFV